MGFQEREEVLKKQRATAAAGDGEGAETPGAGDGEGAAAGDGAAAQNGAEGQPAGDGEGAAAGDTGEGAEGADGKSGNPMQDRVDTMARQKGIAERRAAYWEKIANGEQPTRGEFEAVGKPYRDVKARTQDAPEGAAAAAAAPASGSTAADDYDGSDPSDPPPKREDFTTDDGVLDEEAYYDARADYRWRVNERIKEHKAKQGEQAKTQAQYQREIEDAKTAMLEAGRSRYEDYEAVAHSDDVPITQHMGVAILQSEVGHEIAYHLGRNVEEARRIAELPPAKQMLEIGKLSARFGGESSQGTTDADAAVAGDAGQGDADDTVAGAGTANGSDTAAADTAPPARRTTRAPAAPSAAPTGGGAGQRKPKAGTPDAITAQRLTMREQGRL